MTSTREVAFGNGFVLELLIREGEFLGIGAVRYDGRPLRSAEFPWVFYTESEAGFRFDTFLLTDVETDGEQATIVFSSRGSWLPRVQEADAMGDARIKTRRQSAPTAVFRWRFRPITEMIGENEWTGLAMQLQIDCPGHPVHWAIEDTTWEIGGAAEGCTLIQQDVSSFGPEQTVQADSAFTTIERFWREGEEKLDPTEWGGSYPMDMLPRCAGASPLDFQVKGDTAICLFAEKPSLTRARLQKFRDENAIHYIDRPFFPLTEHAVLPERKLLVYRQAQPLTRHAWRNLWLDCFTEVRRRIHANYGFRLDPPKPLAWVFLWNGDLGICGANWTDALRAALPEYKRLGYPEVYTHGVWEGTSNDPAAEMKNICCNYDFHYAKEFGGAEAMKRVADDAHRLGLKLWQWFGMAFDNRSRVWKEHPEWILHEANGDRWDAAYGFGCMGSFRTGFRDYMLGCLKDAHEQAGLDGAFWDSYQNLGVTGVNWQAPDKAPHAEEIWRFQAELQKLGYSHRCEVTTIFGTSNVQMYGFDNPDGPTWKGLRRRAWRRTVENDEAFAWLDCGLGFFSEKPFTADRLSPKYYFWLMGHRCVPWIDARPWGPTHNGKPMPGGGPALPGGDLAEEYARCNHLYNAALPRMHRLRLTEGGKYTLWLDAAGRPSVIWAFQDAQADYSGTVVDLETHDACEAAGTLALKAGHVYLLGRTDQAASNSH